MPRLTKSDRVLKIQLSYGLLQNSGSIVFRGRFRGNLIRGKIVSYVVEGRLGLTLCDGEKRIPLGNYERVVRLIENGELTTDCSVSSRRHSPKQRATNSPRKMT